MVYHQLRAWIMNIYQNSYARSFMFLLLLSVRAPLHCSCAALYWNICSKRGLAEEQWYGIAFLSVASHINVIFEEAAYGDQFIARLVVDDINADLEHVSNCEASSAATRFARSIFKWMMAIAMILCGRSDMSRGPPPFALIGMTQNRIFSAET